MTAPKANRRVGAYAKLLANYASDDAIIEAGEAAELLFVRGLAFCATSDSDGFITDAQVTRYVGAGMKDARRRADALARCGLWEKVDGGFLVRSWTKIHETAADKGRRRKADRERKRRTESHADSSALSEQIPDGIPTEGRAESLSMTVQDTTEHDSATTEQVGTTSRGQRNVPLRAVDATRPTCSRHPDGDSGSACGGCAKVREWDDRHDADGALAARRAADDAHTAAVVAEIDEAKRNAVPRPASTRNLGKRSDGERSAS